MMFSGIELFSVEVFGRLPLARARELLPPSVTPRVVDGAVEVGLLCFRMQRLAPDFGRRFGLDYSEALWRLGVEWRGQPAWLGTCCDVDRASVRIGGRRLMRYPVRRAGIDVGAGAVRVERRDRALRLRLTEHGATPDPIPPRPLLVTERGRTYRIPWREDPAPERRAAHIDVVEDSLARSTLGAVVWEPEGLVHRGRGHHCGVAERVE
jgi:uncharacterized protein YqjF (DUF2071 family)